MLQIFAATQTRAWFRFRQCPSPVARPRVRHRRRAQRACVNTALGRQFGRRRRRVLRHRVVHSVRPAPRAPTRRAVGLPPQPCARARCRPLPRHVQSTGSPPQPRHRILHRRVRAWWRGWPTKTGWGRWSAAAPPRWRRATVAMSVSEPAGAGAQQQAVLKRSRRWHDRRSGFGFWAASTKLSQRRPS